MNICQRSSYQNLALVSNGVLEMRPESIVDDNEVPGVVDLGVGIPIMVSQW
jgi:hypothetical protein